MRRVNTGWYATLPIVAWEESDIRNNIYEPPFMS